MFSRTRQIKRQLAQQSGARFVDLWAELPEDDREAVNQANTCYAYAAGTWQAMADVDHRCSADAAPQPGDGSGVPKYALLLLQAKSMSFWLRLAERDGLQRLDVRGHDELPSAPRGHRLVAMVYSLARKDYHWLRQEPDGFWSHKRGKHEPTAYDLGRQLIIDPRRADLGDYDPACAFFTVPTRGIEVRLSDKWLRVLQGFEALLERDDEALRGRLWTLAFLVERELPQLAEYINELAGQGNPDAIRRFWQAMSAGDKLAAASSLTRLSVKVPDTDMHGYQWQGVR